MYKLSDYLGTCIQYTCKKIRKTDKVRKGHANYGIWCYFGRLTVNFYRVAISVVVVQKMFEIFTNILRLYTVILLLSSRGTVFKTNRMAISTKSTKPILLLALS